MRFLLFFFSVVAIFTNTFEARGALEEGFYRWNDLPVKPNQDIRRAVYASVHVSVQGVLSASTGTGILVSPDGYILTSLHVIEAALDFQNYRKLISKGKKIIDVYKTRNPNLTALSISIPELGVFNKVRVIALGKYESTIIQEGKALERPEVVYEDWAILKVDLPQRLNCLAVANPEASLRNDQKVWQVGMATSAYRENKKGSDGFSKYVTYGQVHSVENLSKPLDLGASASEIRTGYFGTTSDLVYGMSGGPVVDENLEIFGISTLINYQQEDRERGGSDLALFETTGNRAMALSIFEIRKSLVELVGDKKLNQIFSCSQNSTQTTAEGSDYELNRDDLSSKEYFLGLAKLLRNSALEADEEKSILIDWSSQELAARLMRGKDEIETVKVAQWIDRDVKTVAKTIIRDNLFSFLRAALEGANLAIEDIDPNLREQFLSQIVASTIGNLTDRSLKSALRQSLLSIKIEKDGLAEASRYLHSDWPQQDLSIRFPANLFEKK